MIHVLMKVKSLKGSSFIFWGVESLGKLIKQRKINLCTVIGNENEHLQNRVSKIDCTGL